MIFSFLAKLINIEILIILIYLVYCSKMVFLCISYMVYSFNLILWYINGFKPQFRFKRFKDHWSFLWYWAFCKVHVFTTLNSKFTYSKSPKFKSPKLYNYIKTWLRLMKYMSLAEIRGFLGQFLMRFTPC